MKEASLVSMICDMASGASLKYKLSAKEELEKTGRIKFILTPYGYYGKITHWHIRHIKSNELFITLA